MAARLPRSADVVVVGGGTAGAVVAGRLAERGDRSVVVIEDGPDYGARDEGRWPADLLDARALATSHHDWGYRSGARQRRAPDYRQSTTSTTWMGRSAWPSRRSTCPAACAGTVPSPTSTRSAAGGSCGWSATRWSTGSSSSAAARLRSRSSARAVGR